MARRRDGGGEAPPYSLRRRLLVLIIGGTSLLWLASLVVMATIAWRETNDVFDDALKESCYLILAATGELHEPGLLSKDGAAGAQPRKVEVHYQIVARGRVVQRTRGAPADPFISGATPSHKFADVARGGARWRAFAAASKNGGFEVQVGQQSSRRLQILEELAESLVFPALGLLCILGAASWFVIGRLIRPLDAAARAIAGKSRDDLSMVPTAGQPVELRPVVAALNGVLARLDATLQAERRFTADAAHELRTPLAALRMDVQLLQRQHPGLSAPLQHLRLDIDRSTRLVDNLLMLARLDPLAPDALALRPVSVTALFETIAAEHGDALLLRCGAQVIDANAELLHIVFRNLVDNALRYGHAGCVVELSAIAHEGCLRLAVADDGPGVDPGQQVRLSERFFRVLGSGATGSGLGLSIVRRIVELHGASMAFGPGLDGRGLGVTIDFQHAGRAAPTV